MNHENDTARQVRIIEAIDPSEWNALAVHPMQSFEWGEARKKTGVRIRRFGEYADGKISAVYLMTVHKLPKLPYFIGYVPRSAVPSAAAISFFRAWAKKEKIIFIKWEPYVSAEEEAGALAASGMRLSRQPLFSEWNQEVSLLPSEEEIFARFRKNTRYAVRYAEKNGVTVREMSTDEGFKIFSDLYFGTVVRQKYHGHTRAYHRIIWEALAPSGIARIFVAFHDGKPQTAFELFFFGDRAYYPYSGSDRSADRRIPSAELLMWSAIKAAKTEGKHTLDLWGSLPPDHEGDHPWQGFTHFKSGFGSEFVRMAKSHDLVIAPLFYLLYGAAYGLRKLVWRSGIF